MNKLEFSMLLVNSNRSKAYIQNLVNNGFLPKKVVVLDNKYNKASKQTYHDALVLPDTSQQCCLCYSSDIKVGFNEKEHILTTINSNNINHIIVNSVDVNSNTVIQEISNLPTKYIIYSGPSGMILRHDILSQGKKFIHVHPGWLPDFRGSTTIYYSMLLKKSVAATVIILDESIDTGSILHQSEFTINETNVDFDHVLDPCLRAKVLLDFFQSNAFNPKEQNENKNNVFYIAHPIIKHLSILGHKKNVKLGHYG